MVHPVQSEERLISNRPAGVCLAAYDRSCLMADSKGWVRATVPPPP